MILCVLGKFIRIYSKILLVLPPQRLFSNNHNMHVCPQTVESTEAVFGFDFFHGQVGGDVKESRTKNNHYANFVNSSRSRHILYIDSLPCFCWLDDN